MKKKMFVLIGLCLAAGVANAGEACDWRCDAGLAHVNSYANMKAESAFITDDGKVAVEALGSDVGAVTYIGHPSTVIEGEFVVETIMEGYLSTSL